MTSNNGISRHHHMLCDALADSIRERLFRHEYAPGQVLDESALAARYGVGRLPLTRALQQLSGERLLWARAEGGYAVAEYSRADLENILDLLEQIRQFMMLRRASRDGAPGRSAADSIAESPYWGSSGLAVAQPFVIAARNLYDQLRLCVGPRLPAIETWCAGVCWTDMDEVVLGGESGRIGNFCAETARLFRQRALDAFDVAHAARLRPEEQESQECPQDETAAMPLACLA